MAKAGRVVSIGEAGLGAVTQLATVQAQPATVYRAGSCPLLCKLGPAPNALAAVALLANVVRHSPWYSDPSDTSAIEKECGK